MVSARTLAYLRLGSVPGVGPVIARRALAAFGSPEAVFKASPASLAAVEGVGAMRVKNFANAPTLAQVQLEVVRAEAAGIKIITPEDPMWPQILNNIPDPPIVLYVRGEIRREDALAIGIVGSRKCTHYGREMAERFGAMLAQANMTVISGGARGIDTGAHEGALRAGGRTIVVQGCGMLTCYPPENEKLYERIVNEGRGAIISELPLDAQPLAEHFPPRNRIIAGLSLGILVVEATMKSGSLITARLAIDDYNRDVFAVPGRVDSGASAGTHFLIKTGRAKLVENVQDILDGLGSIGDEISRSLPAAPEKAEEPVNQNPPALRITPKPTELHIAGDHDAPLFDQPPEPPATPKSAEPTPKMSAPARHVPKIDSHIVGFTAVQTKILETLSGGEELHVDRICERAGLSAAVVMAELTMLQIRGAIRRLPSNRYAKR